MPAYRAPQIDLASLIAQDNPHIDLKVQNYETSTRNFLKAVTDYKNRAISTISERRTTQEAEKKRLAEKSRNIEAESEACKLKEIQLMADLEREQQERKDAEILVASCKRQLSSLKEKCASIEAELEHYRAITANLQRERQKERTTLSEHASSVSPELEVCQEMLGCVIEGIESSQLLVRFSLLDPSHASREFSFVIDVSDRNYKIPMASPVLPSLGLLVDELNETRDIYAFVRRVRQEYVQLVTDCS